MSFKWKWLITTFIAQLLIGSIFASIQFKHMTNEAMKDVDDSTANIQLELGRAVASLKDNSPKSWQVIARQLYTRYSAKTVWVTESGKIEYVVRDKDKSKETEDYSTLSPDPALLRSFTVPNSKRGITIQFDKDYVYQSRNDMAIYLVGVFGLSAFACAMILLGLGNALSSRLEQLRVKAICLQAGDTKSRIEVSGRDEISCLGLAFNSMANAIEEQITAMEKTHAHSISEKNRLDLLLSSLTSGVAYLDEHFNVLYVNKALAKMLKIDFPQTESLHLHTLLIAAGVVKEQRASLKDLVTEFFRNHEMPVELDFNDGRVLQLRFALYNDKIQGPHGVMIVEDVSIRKNVEDLRNEVERDPLTNVLNRRGFEMTLESKLARLLPSETLGVMFLDLDGFKSVNDTLGHKSGDQILKTSANLFKGATRNIDLVARLGGDEFAIIVVKANQQLMRNISERIIESFARDKLMQRIRQNHHLTVSCSIGCAMYPNDGQTMSELLEVSDRQMYLAKKAGKNCYKIAANGKEDQTQDA